MRAEGIAVVRHGSSGMSGMSDLTVEGVRKQYGTVTAVDDVSFEAEGGKLTVLLGPSGCGKSTLLRIIAGLEPADAGIVRIGSEPLTSVETGVFVPPERRRIGMVFQSYAVWPHLDVFGNVAFPLKLKGAARQEIRAKVMEALRLVGLEGLEERYSSQLSGGQAQRVAIARALTCEPRLLLMDEPLSSLDARLRSRLRTEMRLLQRRLGLTVIFVTHDQLEAMYLADQIVVMNAGRVEQLGPAREIYKDPRNRFVAEFFGTPNVFEGEVKQTFPERGICIVETDGGALRCSYANGDEAGRRVAVFVRPEDIQLARTADLSNARRGRVSSVIFLGGHVEYQLDLDGQLVQAHGDGSLPLREADEVFVGFDPEDAVLLDAGR